jgi:hypothetical protein
VIVRRAKGNLHEYAYPLVGLNHRPKFRSTLRHFDGRSTLSVPACPHLQPREACALVAFGRSAFAAGLGLARRPLHKRWSATQVPPCQYPIGPHKCATYVILRTHG